MYFERRGRVRSSVMCLVHLFPHQRATTAPRRRRSRPAVSNPVDVKAGQRHHDGTGRRCRESAKATAAPTASVVRPRLHASRHETRFRATAPNNLYAASHGAGLDDRDSRRSPVRNRTGPPQGAAGTGRPGRRRHGGEPPQSGIGNISQPNTTAPTTKPPKRTAPKRIC